MDKKTNIFGFDRTPRKALWGKIEEQAKIIKSLENECECIRDNKELVRGLEMTLEAIRGSIADSERKIAERDKEIVCLRSQLARFNRSKDNTGAFLSANS